MGKYEKSFSGRPVEEFDFDEILYEKNGIAGQHGDGFRNP